MIPAPRPALEMIQAQLFLHLLVALLHRPAALPEPHRLESARPGRQVREGELNLAVGLLLDQQPVRLRVRTGAPLPALSRPDAHPTEAARQLPLGPLTPSDFPAGQTLGQFPEGDRSRALLGQPGQSPRSATPRWPGWLPPGLLGEDHHLRGDAHDVE